MRLYLSLISCVFLSLVVVHAELPLNYDSTVPNVAYLITGLPRDFLIDTCVYTSIHRTVIMGISGDGPFKHANPFVFMHFSVTRPEELDVVYHEAWLAVEKLYSPVHVDFDPPGPVLDGEGSFLCARWAHDRDTPERLRVREVEQYVHIEESFDIALEYERTHNVTFDYFARLRFDVTFGRELPGLRELYPPKDSTEFDKWYSPARTGGFESDQFALLPRSTAPRYFRIASSTFVHCNETEHQEEVYPTGEVMVRKTMKGVPHAQLPTCWFFVKSFPFEIMGWSGQKEDESCLSQLEELRSSCKPQFRTILLEER